MTWFVNYRLDSSVSIADRGFTYGDGVFETIRALPDTFFQLDDHLVRLYRGLSKLGMPLSFEQKNELIGFLCSQVLGLIKEESVVKIMVTRGEGGRGYLPPEEITHSIVIGVLSAPDYQVQQSKGVSLSVSPVPVNNNRFLSGIKHLNRLENVMAKRFLMAPDFEAIMLNTDGELIECIQSNLFWFKNGVIHTPSLEHAGVQGTYRKAIIESQFYYTVQIGHFSLSDIIGADEVFITNSLMGVVPVVNITTHTGKKFFPVGVHTRKLQVSMQAKDPHGIY